MSNFDGHIHLFTYCLCRDPDIHVGTYDQIRLHQQPLDFASRDNLG